MAQAVDRRLNQDGGIAGRWAAQHADVRTLGDLVAFALCALLTVALALMVTHPREFFALVMGG